MKKRKRVTRKPAVRRRRKSTMSGSAVGVRRRRRTTKKGLLSGQTGDALGLILGGIITGLVDKPLSGVVSDAKLRSAVKAGLGFFLMNKPGIVGGIGKGMLAVGGMQLAGALAPQTISEDIPSLISGDIPSLISEAMDELDGYTSDEIADEFGYTSDEIADEFGDEFGEDDDIGEDDDMGYQADELSYEFGEDELMGI